MITRSTMDAAIYLHPDGGEEELDARFGITVESWPAEPTTWGASRGLEYEVTARLIEWTRHGERMNRDDAVAIEGEARIAQQEEWAAMLIEPDRWAIPALDD